MHALVCSVVQIAHNGCICGVSVTIEQKKENVSSDVHYCYSIKVLAHVLADINSYLECSRTDMS